MNFANELQIRITPSINFLWQPFTQPLNEDSIIYKGNLLISSISSDETPRNYYCCLMPFNLIRVIFS